ncbi:MAG: hypothetical protein IPL03_02015 [Sterolibacteriaceae bacterium]|nr:hypothetical protein [Candidatus Methylophosphatis haderslevensis]
MNPRAAALPIPGLLLGAYPERREPRQSGTPPGLGALRTLVDRADALQRRRDRQFVARVRAHDAALAAASAEAMQAALRGLRIALRRDGLRGALLAQALGCACRAARQTLGFAPFDTQIIAARIVLDNRLAEMATGEGKTLAVALAAATAALAGIPVHVITANDYLVTRDAQTLQPLYAALGLSVGAVTQEQSPEQRRAGYACDITYCTAKELVFDYLRDGLGRTRDGLQWRLEQLAGGAGQPAPLLRGLCMAIVDEADSILIDEARVPLILSRPVDAGQQAQYLEQSLRIAAGLRQGAEFHLQPEAMAATLSAAGCARLEREAAGLGPVWHNRLHREESVASALAALHLYRRDRHYMVREAKVHIIDETTGRIAAGRAWSRGLHQLIELKEGLAPTAPYETIAQITYQRFFPRYLRLGGLSGTLAESRAELLAIYGLPVRRVPLRRPSRRKVLPGRLFADRAGLWEAVAARVQAMAQSGRPVLVGTDSVADSASLSRRLSEAGLVHAVLDARFDREEAAIVAAAGARGAITVATNMAGRGTDIQLGDGVAEQGGLHILCCQVNAARRIDRQLAGRCARQGDPGSVETWLSLQSPLLRGRLPGRLLGLLRRRAARLPGWVTPALVGLLQRLEERRHVAQRKRLLEFDRNLDHRLSFAPRH